MGAPVTIVNADGSPGSLTATIAANATVVPNGLTFGVTKVAIAASQTAQVLGATGAAGDYLAGLLVSPGTAACGLVSLLDGATSYPVFAGGGVTALPSLIPFWINIGMKCTTAWKVTTGANVTVLAAGQFT